MLNWIFYSRTFLILIIFILFLFKGFDGQEMGIILSVQGLFALIYGLLKNEKGLYPVGLVTLVVEIILFLALLLIISTKALDPRKINFTEMMISVVVIELLGLVTFFFLFERAWPKKKYKKF
jgi:hypothetical protein